MRAGIGLVKYVQVVDVIGFEGGIGLEFAVPIPFLSLNG